MNLMPLIKYNEAIKLAREVDDEGSVDLLTRILKMEEGHVVGEKSACTG